MNRWLRPRRKGRPREDYDGLTVREDEPRPRPPPLLSLSSSTIFALLVIAAIISPSSALNRRQLVLARPPTFTYDASKWMERVTVLEGAPLSLHCPHVDPGATVSWRHNESSSLDGGGALLHRPQSSREDTGEWRCVAQQGQFTVLSRPTIVTVLYMDDFAFMDDSSYGVSVVADAAFVLRRPPLDGAPESALKPVYLWYCNEAQVYPNSSHYLTATGDLVVLDNPRGRTPQSSFSSFAQGPEERCEVTASVDGMGEIRSRSFVITRHASSSFLPSRNDFAIIYSPQEETTIIVRDEDERSTDDESIRFDCVPSLTDASVRWFLDDKQLSEQDQGVSLEKSGRRLVLSPAAQRTLLTALPSPRRVGRRQSITRKLECKADAGAGRLFDSKTTKLRIIRAPQIAPLPPTVHRRIEDGNVELACQDQRGATTLKNFRWIFNGKQLLRSPKVSISLSPSSFGVYQCEAKNAAGVDVATVWLQEGTASDDLGEMNEGMVTITEDEVEEESSTKQLPPLDRRVSSLLSQSSDEMAPPADNESRFHSHLDSIPTASLLNIHNIPRNAVTQPVAAPSDDSLVRLGPTIIRPPSDIVITAGEPSFSLECQVQPASSTITWRFNDTPITPSAKYGVEDRGTKLIVRDSRKADAGVYQCEARNDAGVTHAVARVTVAGGALLEYGPTNQSYLIGTNIEIPCQVSEEFRGKAEITWFVDGDRVPSSGNPSLRISLSPNGALLIKQVGPDNIHQYRCEVRLGKQKEEAAGWLKILERPGMPRHVSADLILNGNKLPKVMVEWQTGFDGNSPILRHVIEMRTLSAASVHPHWSSWERVVDNVPTETCCSSLLESVRPSSTAQFRVVAVNKLGSGKPSLPSANLTLPQMPPAAAPTNVLASARSSRVVMVQWQRPNGDEWNGDINGYLVRHRLDGYSVPWNTVNITDGQRRNYAVEGLLVWKEYEFQVAAYNDRGEGVFSPSVRATTLEGAPTQAPKAVEVSTLNATTIRITFEEPDEQFINGVNLGYKVRMREMKMIVKENGEEDFEADDDGPLMREIRVEPDSAFLEVLLDDLRPFTHAQLTVVCYTAIGDGPASPAVTVITEEDVPGSVDDLHVDNVLFSEALVIWAPPKQPNGRILNYEVRYWSEMGVENMKTVKTKGSERNYTLLGLSASTKYVVDVRANTAKGEGPREEVRFESGVPPELPGRPSGLAASNISSRSVTLSFTPGFDGHSPIRTWFVEARQAEGGLFHAIYNISAPKAKSLLVTGLRPHTTYQLRLIAENVRGRGAPSEPSTVFKTAQAIPEAPSSKVWAEPLSATAITLSWTPLQNAQWNGEPIGYLIVYRVANRTRTEEEEEWGDEEDHGKNHEVRTRSLRATELTLKSLKPWTTYEIELYAENVVGRSKSREGVTTRTYEAAPSAAPSDVRVEPKGEKGATVSWSAVGPAARNGRILGYTVRLIPDDSLPAWRRAILTRSTTVDSADHRTETFTGLRPATTYKVTVAARTIIGDGPESKEALVRTKGDVPGRPSKVTFTLISTSEARIKFFPPDDPNGVITQYFVTYHRADDPDPETSKVTAPVPPTMFTFTAMGLMPRHKYVFGVAAQNEEGVGEAAMVQVWTAPPNETLPLPNPSMPQWNMRKTRSSSEISIQWTEEGIASKEDEHGYQQPARGVEIQYQRANDANWTSYPEMIAGTENTATVKGLSPNSAYAFRVRFGGDYSVSSAWSAESEWIRTLPAAPARAPASLSLAPDDSDSVALSFAPPDRWSWNSDAIGFTVHYKEYAGGEARVIQDEGWREVEVPPKTEFAEEERVRFVLRPLKGFRHYVVQVRAKNSEGFSPPSTPGFVYVGFAVPKRNVTGLVVEPLSSSSLSVRWDALPNDQITGFKVRFAPLLSVLKPREELEGGLVVVEENTAILSDLMKYTEYQVSVSPYNRAGEGGSAQARVSTLEDAPGPVGKLRFTDVLLNSVNVSWDVPTERNGEIVGYVVSWRMGSIRGDTRQETQVPTTNSFHVADRLLEGETYHFSVRAETRAGKGPAVDGDVTVGPVEGGPAAPSEPRLVPGQSAVRLEWKEAAMGRKDERITGHVIQAKRVGRAVNKTLAASAGDDSHRRRRAHTSGEKRPVHTIGDWITVAVVDGAEPAVEIRYMDLHPSSYYVFRVYSRTARGVGRPSQESAQLFVPETLPSDMFYTSPWFVAVAGLSLLLLLVVVVACLCVTGRGGAKKSPSSHSLHYDGNFPMQMTKDGRSHLRRNNDMLTRPGTNTSWLSERDGFGGTPAYGHAAIGGRGSSGGDSGRGGSSPEQVVNMYGLATDVIPSSVDGRRRHDGSVVSGSEYGTRLPLGLGSVHNQSVYGTATIRPANVPLREYDADSFDDDFDDEDEMETRRRGAGNEEEEEEGAGDIASHYAQADQYRDTWRRVRESEAVPMREVMPAHLSLPPTYPAPGHPTSSVTSHRSHHTPSQMDSVESASETSWHTGAPSSTAPALAKGFSSFV